VIEDLLANPSGFDQETFTRTRDQAFADMDAQHAAQLGNTRASAASRGMFFGSPLTTAEGTLESNLARAKAGVNTSLLQRQAETQGQDLNQAIQTAMQFGSNANLSAEQQAQMGQMMMQSGFAGGATPAQMLQMFGGKSGAVDPALFQMLGQMFGNQGG